MSLLSWLFRPRLSSVRRAAGAARPRLEALEDRLAPALSISSFAVPAALANPAGITAGPDGNLWFVENSVGVSQIGRISTSGVIAQFGSLATGSGPDAITAGPDGNLWFTETNGNKVGRITTAGVITEFLIPTSVSQPDGITAGPDGNLWFVETQGNKVGRITPFGAITEFNVPTANSRPVGITAGPDGDLWFTQFTGNRIGRITTSGSTTEFLIPTTVSGSAGNTSGPQGITLGPDGALWFLESQANNIARITTSGAVTEIPVLGGVSGNTAGAGIIGAFPQGITRGPDNALWFVQTRNDSIARLTFSAPLVNAGGNGTATAGQPFVRTGTFTVDAPLGATVIVNFGDGTGVQPVAVSGNTFTLSHVFATAGTFVVTVNVNNGFGSTDAFFAVQVNSPAPPVLPFQRATPGVFAVGTGPGGLPLVNVFDSQTGALKYQLHAFDDSFHGGVRVAVGVLGGQDVIVAGAGPGGFPLVRLFRGSDGAPLGQFFAFDAGFSGGVFVAAGDLRGDGTLEIVAGADASPSGFPLLSVHDTAGNEVSPFILAFDAGFKGGVRVAVGAPAGGAADIVAGAGPGGLPLVQVINGRSFARQGSSFTVFDPGFSGGIYVAAGDLNRDGVLDVVAGADASPVGLPLVNVHDANGNQTSPNVLAFDAGFKGGVRVAVTDLTGGQLDIVAGAGPGGFPVLQALDGRTLARKGAAFPAFNDGTGAGLFPAGDQL